MAFILDTNIAIGLRDRDLGIIRRVGALGDDLLLSIVTRVELEGGIYRDPTQVLRRQAGLAILLETLSVLPFDNRDVEAYGKIVKAAGYSRRKLLDRMIAAQAIARDATLVTLNGADFADIPGLDLQAW